MYLLTRKKISALTRPRTRSQALSLSLYIYIYILYKSRLKQRGRTRLVDPTTPCYLPGYSHHPEFLHVNTQRFSFLYIERVTVIYSIRMIVYIGRLFVTGKEIR